MTTSSQNIAETDLEHVYRVACTVCKKAGYSMRESDYRSAVNYGVARAVVSWDGKSTTLVTWACLLALHECSAERRRRRLLRKGDKLGAKSERGKVEMVDLRLPLSDFEVLQFTAQHGRTKAAKLLCLSPAALREILDGIETRVRQLLS